MQHWLGKVEGEGGGKTPLGRAGGGGGRAFPPPPPPPPNTGGVTFFGKKINSQFVSVMLLDISFGLYPA